MTALKLTLPAVRQLLLEAQGLRVSPPQPTTKEDVVTAIRRMGLLQIDTINVVARSPYLVLFSRLGSYPPGWLDELLAEGRIFECWAHAACFLPAEDYPIHRALGLEGVRVVYSEEWYKHHQAEVDAVLAHVRANGAVRSADFEGKNNPGGWWNWKIEKNALEYWFGEGALMVARRENFQRVYDLRERVRPDWDDARALPLEDAYRALVERSVLALGAVQPGWVWDYFRLPKTRVSALLKQLVAAGRLVEAQVEGWDAPALVHAQRVPQAEAALDGGLQASYTTLLSPFDPLVCDRKRALALFGFDFSIECYLPAPKRKYGYFLLPLLHRGALVGRLDAKAHRKDGEFEVKGLFLEPDVPLSEALAAEVAAAIQRCADWHATPQVRLSRCEPEAFGQMLKNALIR